MNQLVCRPGPSYPLVTRINSKVLQRVSKTCLASQAMRISWSFTAIINRQPLETMIQVSQRQVETEHSNAIVTSERLWTFFLALSLAKPGMFDFQGSAKWKAWDSLKGKRIFTSRPSLSVSLSLAFFVTIITMTWMTGWINRHVKGWRSIKVHWNCWRVGGSSLRKACHVYCQWWLHFAIRPWWSCQKRKKHMYSCFRSLFFMYHVSCIACHTSYIIRVCLQAYR